MTSGLFSSNSSEWETPQDFFHNLDREFCFNLDVCATKENAKCEHYFTPEQDGLSQEWQGTCWMNPPYGREIGKWMEKAVKSMLGGGVTVVCLVPARTDTAWWHTWVMPYASEIRFIKGRLTFNGKAPAPFPSAIVIYRQTRQPIIRAAQT